jgi:hypothetical protein
MDERSGPLSARHHRQGRGVRRHRLVSGDDLALGGIDHPPIASVEALNDGRPIAKEPNHLGADAEVYDDLPEVEICHCWLLSVSGGLIAATDEESMNPTSGSVNTKTNTRYDF